MSELRTRGGGLERSGGMFEYFFCLLCCGFLLNKCEKRQRWRVEVNDTFNNFIRIELIVLWCNGTCQGRNVLLH